MIFLWYILNTLAGIPTPINCLTLSIQQLGSNFIYFPSVYIYSHKWMFHLPLYWSNLLEATQLSLNLLHNHPLLHSHFYLSVHQNGSPVTLFFQPTFRKQLQFHFICFKFISTFICIAIRRFQLLFYFSSQSEAAQLSLYLIYIQYLQYLTFTIFSWANCQGFTCYLNYLTNLYCYLSTMSVSLDFNCFSIYPAIWKQSYVLFNFYTLSNYNGILFIFKLQRSKQFNIGWA